MLNFTSEKPYKCYTASLQEFVFVKRNFISTIGLTLEHEYYLFAFLSWRVYARVLNMLGFITFLKSTRGLLPVTLTFLLKIHRSISFDFFLPKGHK